MSNIEGAFDQVGKRLDSMEHRFEARFASIDGRFAQSDQRFNWVIGVILGTWITAILAILFHH